MAVIGDILPKAVPALVEAVKKCFGGSIPTSNTAQYSTMLAFGYSFLRYHNDQNDLNELVSTIIPAIYEANPGVPGSGGVSASFKQNIYKAPVQFSKYPVITNDTINTTALHAFDTIAFPLRDPCKQAAIDAIVNDIKANANWSAPLINRSTINKISTNGIASVMYVFEYICGFIPDNCSPSTQIFVDTANALFGTNSDAARNAASFLFQNYGLRNMASDGTISVPATIASDTLAGELKTFLSSNGQAQDALRAYLTSNYDQSDLDKVYEMWDTMSAQATPVEQTVVSGDALKKADDDSGKVADSKPEESKPAVSTPTSLAPKASSLLSKMAVDEDQLIQALEVITSGAFHGIPYLTTYVPGLTEKAIITLLDTKTDKKSHRPLSKAEETEPEKKMVQIPPAFKLDHSPAIWTRAVITSMGYPFINFTCPPIVKLLRGTDPKEIRDAYKTVKSMFKQCGLKRPIETLKKFAGSTYRDCALNAMTVDADELYSAEPGTTVSASIVDPYSRNLAIKGSVQVPVDFLTAFYGILSPSKAIRQYTEICGMSQAEYQDYLYKNGKPPVYILNPKKAVFRRGPKGNLLHELFSSKTAPVIVRARISSHDGGFIMPERIADLIFSV